MFSRGPQAAKAAYHILRRRGSLEPQRLDRIEPRRIEAEDDPDQHAEADRDRDDGGCASIGQ
jgi:hypothetical protein